MRRRVLALTFGTMLALFAGAGCTGDDGAPGPAASPTGATSTPAGGGRTVTADPGDLDPTVGTATGNAREVCVAARKVNADQVTAFLRELSAALKAGEEGDRAGADKARLAAAQAVRTWSTGLRAQAARAQDANLRRLLEELAAEVGTVSPNVDSIDSISLDTLQQRLDRACGA